MTIKIVTDSTITVEPELIEKYGITIVPLAILIDGVLYQDTDLSAAQFMSKMKVSKNLPKHLNHLLACSRKFMIN